jgi:hypothetical protein
VGRVVGEVVAEGLHRGLQEYDGAIGVLARATPLHLSRPALQPLEVAGIRAALGDSCARVGESPQAEEARSALC